jgi:HAD superfamily hydrolase (TIGR01458 family)
VADRKITCGLLVDLDGVLYQGGQLVEGADNVIKWMRDESIPHRFVTNTSSRPRSTIVDKLHSMQIEVAEADILTPPTAAISWLKEHTPGLAALFVPEATKQDFVGIDQLPSDAESGASAVVLGDIGDGWTFAELNRAFRLLMTEPKPALVALGMTRYWQTQSGLQLDVAPFVKALEYAADCEAVVLGKPSQEFFNQALLSLDCDASEAMMIGDDVVGDVQGAQRAGIRGALVKTGKFRPRDLEADPIPDVVFDSIADLPEWWAQRSD